MTSSFVILINGSSHHRLISRRCVFGTSKVSRGCSYEVKLEKGQEQPLTNCAEQSDIPNPLILPSQEMGCL